MRSKTVRTANRDHGGRGQAEDALAEFSAKLEDEDDAPASETLQSVMAYYIDHVTRLGKRRGTIETYQMVAKGIPDDLGTRPVETVTPDDLDQFYGQLADSGLAVRTIRLTHAVIRAAVRQAVKSQRIASSPAAGATVPAAPKGAKTRITPAETWEMIRVASLPKDQGGSEDGVLAMAIFLATYAGCRRGELCGLQWSDLDVETGTLRIVRQWVQGAGGQYLADLKSDTAVEDGARTVRLGPSSVEALLRYKAWLRVVIEREPDGWLLSYDAGNTPMRARSLGESITALGRRLGIDATTHSFRRTSSTELVAADVDVDTAARARRSHDRGDAPGLRAGSRRQGSGGGGHLGGKARGPGFAHSGVVSLTPKCDAYVAFRSRAARTEHEAESARTERVMCLAALVWSRCAPGKTPPTAWETMERIPAVCCCGQQYPKIERDRDSHPGHATAVPLLAKGTLHGNRSPRGRRGGPRTKAACSPTRSSPPSAPHWWTSCSTGGSTVTGPHEKPGDDVLLELGELTWAAINFAGGRNLPPSYTPRRSGEHQSRIPSTSTSCSSDDPPPKCATFPVRMGTPRARVWDAGPSR